MNTPKNHYRIDEKWIWAADNGCFGKGYPGDELWLDWLSKFSDEQKRNCLFATAPDVVGDAAATLMRSLPWFQCIRNLGFNVAFVTQDGLKPSMVPWDEIDWLFIGGTNDHKLGSEGRSLIDEACHRAKRIHVGRVNSMTRYLAFKALHCDSCDGTFLGYGPQQNIRKLLSWLRMGQTQPGLFDI